MGSLKLKKGLKWWVSGAKIWPEKRGSWGWHIPELPSQCEYPPTRAWAHPHQNKSMAKICHFRLFICFFFIFIYQKFLFLHFPPSPNHWILKKNPKNWTEFIIVCPVRFENVTIFPFHHSALYSTSIDILQPAIDK